ncbi:MAG: hypothetical protein GY847_01835 [Proteobacteria bacterium]|nr:hypothetical protein [Pseudomonadota bacterium]
MPSVAGITNLSERETLTIASGVMPQFTDIVTGGTSGAVGMVIGGDLLTTVGVVLLSGNFTPGGETLTDQEGENCVSSGAASDGNTDPVLLYTGIEAPDSGTTISGAVADTVAQTSITVVDASLIPRDGYLMVDGDLEILKCRSSDGNSTVVCYRAQLGSEAEAHADGATFNIISNQVFRDIRNAGNDNSWGIHIDPGPTDHFLQLDANIFFGRSDQMERTVVITQKEMVDLQTGDPNHYVAAIGSTVLLTSVVFGDAAFEGADNDETGWPPTRTQYGTHFKSDFSYQVPLQDVSTMTYLFKSTFEMEYLQQNGGFQFGGPTRMSEVTILGGYLLAFANEDIKTDKMVTHDAGGGLIINTGGQEWTNVYNVNQIGCVFMIGVFTGALAQCENFSIAGDVNTKLAAFATSSSITFDNCSFGLSAMEVFWSHYVAMDRKSLDLAFVDYDQNEVPNVNIRLTDGSGNSALSVDSGASLATAAGDVDCGKNSTEPINKTETNITMQSGHGVQVGDYVRFGGYAGAIYLNQQEYMRVAGSYATSITIARAQWNTLGNTSRNGADCYIAQTTLDVSDYTLIDTDDVILVDAERMLVTDGTTNPIGIERGYQNSHASTHEAATPIYKIVDSVQADSEGVVDTLWPLRTWRHVTSHHSLPYFPQGPYAGANLNPFILTCYKDGYETYRYKFDIGDPASFTSYKDEFINMVIKLRNATSQGRDDMAEAFI